MVVTPYISFVPNKICYPLLEAKHWVGWIFGLNHTQILVFFGCQRDGDITGPLRFLNAFVVYTCIVCNAHR